MKYSLYSLLYLISEKLTFNILLKYSQEKRELLSICKSYETFNILLKYSGVRRILPLLKLPRFQYSLEILKLKFEEFWGVSPETFNILLKYSMKKVPCLVEKMTTFNILLKYSLNVIHVCCTIVASDFQYSLEILLKKYIYDPECHWVAFNILLKYSPLIDTVGAPAQNIILSIFS